MGGASPAMTKSLGGGTPSPSALEQPDDRRFGERVEMQLESDHRRRGIRAHPEFGFDRVHREEIAVRMVAFRRTGPAISGNAEIRPGLQRSLRQLAAREIA